MKKALESISGWLMFAAVIAALVVIGVLFQAINDAGQEAGGFIGFLADWFFG